MGASRAEPLPAHLLVTAAASLAKCSPCGAQRAWQRLLHVLQEARVQRVTSIQNYAATMANMQELSTGFKAFWEQLPGGDDLQARFREFQVCDVCWTCHD